MDGKDWLLVVAALVIFGGPVGHAIWRRSRGTVSAQPGGETMINDVTRLGMAVTTTGGRALAEGAKLLKYGALRYANDQSNKANQWVGGP